MDARVRRCLELIDNTEALVSNKVVDGSKPKRTNKLTNTLIGLLRELFIEPSTQAIRVSALTTFCYHHGIDLVTYSYELQKQAGFTVRADELLLDVNSNK